MSLTFLSARVTLRRTSKAHSNRKPKPNALKGRMMTHKTKTDCEIAEDKQKARIKKLDAMAKADYVRIADNLFKSIANCVPYQN